MALSIDEIRSLFSSWEWIYAKSYSKTFPHRYTTKDRCPDPAMFEEALRFIRENAIAKAFFKKTYLYFELDGHEYWEMGRPIKSVVVLNRAPIDDGKAYRKRAVTLKERDLLIQKMNKRDEYHQSLLQKNLSQLTSTEKEDLDWLNQSQRKSSNILDDPYKRIALNHLNI